MRTFSNPWPPTSLARGPFQVRGPQPLWLEDLFKSVAPNLFGSRFEQKMKQRGLSNYFWLLGRLCPRNFFVGAAPLSPEEAVVCRQAEVEDSGPRKTLQARNSLSTSGPFCFTRQRPVKFTHFRSKGFKLSKYSCQFISPKGGNILERPNRSEYPSHSWKVNTLPKQLGSGPIGLGHNPELQTGIPEEPLISLPWV